MIIADSSALIALMDRDDRHHAPLNKKYQSDPGRWVFPWAILPEVDYVAGRRLGSKVRHRFVEELRTGLFTVEWGREEDLRRAAEIDASHHDLELGLVDAVVMTVAERIGAEAIATLDLRHFAAVRLKRPVKLYPRDL